MAINNGTQMVRLSISGMELKVILIIQVIQ